MAKWKVFILFILEGIASIGFQVVAIRQFIPHFGSAIEVTSIVIAFFLLALTVGYYLGGNVKDKVEIPRYLSINFVLAAVMIGSMFSSYMLGTVFSYVNLSGGTFDLIYLSLYCFLFIGIPVTLLGTTLPFLSNYIKTSTQSKNTGLSLSFSTIGSFFGAILTSLVLFYYLGVSGTIVALCVILYASAIIAQHKSTVIYLTIAFTLPILATINLHPTFNPNLTETAYADYRVEIKKDVFGESRLFRINNQNASFHMSRLSSNPYIIKILDLMTNNYGYKNSEVLVLGAGGFSISHYDKTDNNYTYVDIDPKIKDIAETHFLETSIKGKLITQDARQFLAHNSKKYDVLIIDLFSHKGIIPWHVRTNNFFNLAKKSIHEDSIVIMNVVGNMRLGSKDNRIMHNTITSVFPYCFVDMAILKNVEHEQNLIYVCFPHNKEKEVFNDDNTFSFLPN